MAKTAKTHKEMLRKQTKRRTLKPLTPYKHIVQHNPSTTTRRFGKGQNINFSNFSKETLNFLKRAANFSRKRAEKTELEQSYKALEKAENIRKHANHHTRRNRH